MSMTDSEQAEFFAAVDAAARKGVWAALATVRGGDPRVRLVHPTWEGETLWFATFPDSAKARQIEAHPSVDFQWQVAPPDFVHVMARGRAELVDEEATRKHVWEVLDYDLSQFWPGGPSDPTYVPVRVTPERVELSKMFGSQDKRVWRRS